MTPFLGKKYDPKEMVTARGVLVRKRNSVSLTVFQKGDVGRSPESMHPALEFWLLPPLAEMVVYGMQKSGLTLWDIRLGTWCFLTELFQGICFQGNPQSTSNCLGSLYWAGWHCITHVRRQKRSFFKQKRILTESSKQKMIREVFCLILPFSRICHSST